MPEPAGDQPLPNGFRVRLDRQALHLTSERLLVGGSPLTAVRLSAAADAHLHGDRVNVTDATSALLADRLIATNLAHPDTCAAPAAAAHDVTVVVPVRDRPEQLDRCLASLCPLQVIVVDDASRDPEAVAAVASRHGATLVALTANVGPAGARNTGLAQVRTPVVAFVDSDVEATSAALLRLTRHLSDPAVVLVGPRVVGHVRSKRPRWFEQYDAAASSLTLGTTPNTVRPGAAVAWLPSACLVARTTSLGGGFDARLRVGEDVDLVWRLVAGGHRVRYEPAVTVQHDVRPTIRGWLGRKFVYGSGGAGLATRHGSHVAPAVLSPTMAIAGAAVLMRRRWSFPVVLATLILCGRSIESALPATLPRRTRMGVAARLSARGTGWAVRQETALLLRHWWPAAAFGCVVSPSIRRAVSSALVIDTCVVMAQQTADAPGLPVLLTGRRLDDLAYGAGLWWGAARSRSVQALRPRRPGDPRAPDPAPD